MTFGVVAFAFGWVAGGFGAVGQPHIAIRTMALRSPEDIPVTRRYYFLWFLPFFFMAIGVGLHARVLLPDLLEAGGAAAERALPELSIALLPDVLVGLVLAGLFLRHDVDRRLAAAFVLGGGHPGPVSALEQLVRGIEGGHLGRCGVFPGRCPPRQRKGLFLVLDAWAVLAATLGPVLVVRVYGRKLEPAWALVMMASGFAAVVGWAEIGYDGAMYKLVPGLLVPFAIYFASRPLASSK